MIIAALFCIAYRRFLEYFPDNPAVISSIFLSYIGVVASVEVIVDEHINQ
jgi:hypothetical protein